MDVERSEGEAEYYDDDQGYDGEYADEDYDFSAPFNGNGQAYDQPAENDLMPRSYPELADSIPKKKKPIDETSRVPNTPWIQLNTDLEEDNDINFDVGSDFKFRMPTTENFKGRDVKFNVKLPKDLLGGSAQP